jgi:hypothetical protein
MPYATVQSRRALGFETVSPNKSLQRSWTHKVLGRGRPSESAHRRWRARVLKCRRAAAELGR